MEEPWKMVMYEFNLFQIGNDYCCVFLCIKGGLIGSNNYNFNATSLLKPARTIFNWWLRAIRFQTAQL